MVGRREPIARRARRIARPSLERSVLGSSALITRRGTSRGTGVLNITWCGALRGRDRGVQRREPNHAHGRGHLLLHAHWESSLVST